jgi:hypothetical protein
MNERANPKLQEENFNKFFFSMSDIHVEEGRRGKEDLLSRRLRFWMPSWPMRALRPKREKPRMELSMGMDVE